MEAAANGNTSRREGLARDIIGADMEVESDYNAVLAELIEHHRQTHALASQITNLKTRAIASMVAADIPRQIIADLLHMSTRQIRRILRHI